MQCWSSLTIAEQTLLRRAMTESPLARTIQTYGIYLRWAGADGAPPPRSYSDDEQRALVPQLAAVAMDLVARGLIGVREQTGPPGASADVTLDRSQVQAVLADPANWLHARDSVSRYRVCASQAVPQEWFDDAYPTADTSGLPSWEQLTEEEQMVLVCAAEASAMLTGPFGIWEDPPADLDAARRQDWINQQISPLLRFVRNGWIEVHHYPEPGSDKFTVIPFDQLPAALADPGIRYDGDDWGVGVGCVFTHTGLAVWRGGWSRAWSARLSFD